MNGERGMTRRDEATGGFQEHQPTGDLAYDILIIAGSRPWSPCCVRGLAAALPPARVAAFDRIRDPAISFRAT